MATPAADEVHAAARRQAWVEERAAAAIRALAREPGLHFRGGRLHRDGQRLPWWAPHLHLPAASAAMGTETETANAVQTAAQASGEPGTRLAQEQARAFRGAADGLALRLRFSDAQLHQHLAPEQPLRRALFDWLEQFRVEALAGPQWPGVQANLRSGYLQWCESYHGSGLNETARGLLLFSFALIGRARVSGEPVPHAYEDLIESTRAGIVGALGDGLAGLRRWRADQARYAQFALRLADAAAQLLEAAGPDIHTHEAPADSAASRRQRQRAFGLLLEAPPQQQLVPMPGAALGTSSLLADGSNGYRVFTRTYDAELQAGQLLRRTSLLALRQQLDEQLHSHRLHVPLLVRRLQAALARPSAPARVGAQEEGRIDGSRLAGLVARPQDHRIFQQERLEPRCDVAVTFLLDCSGSMRRHAPTTAVLVDVFARALELAGAQCEVLGFTTRAWHGGRALRDWQRAGSPPHPGRLNEAAHLVFKAAETPVRRARPALAALLRGEIYREGIDGEALAWAAQRLMAVDSTRRILVVFSDGCPMDSATQDTNDEAYLDHHLQQVAAELERNTPIELAAVGFGLDLSAHYGRCLALDLEHGVGQRMLNDIVTLISRPSRR